MFAFHATWLSTAPLVFGSVPVIQSFTPASGVPGTSVNITGTNFDPVAGNNVVYFGAVRAEVNAASPTNLSVTVPVGATFAPITETVNGVTADSTTLFLPTFPGTAPLSATSLSNFFNLNGGSLAWGVAVADIDGDGKPDLVLGNAGDSSIWIYRNISSNGILSPSSFAAPVILYAAPAMGHGAGIPLTLADLDGDGRLDIVFANFDEGTVSVFQNLSTPGNLTSNSFAPRLDFAVGTYPQGSVATDLDGDGRPDIVVINWASASMSVLRNLSTGGLLTTNSFAPALNFATPGGPVQIVAADLDGDGKFDLVIANNQSTSDSALSIFRNTSTPGSISFAPRLDLAAADNTEECIAVADIDGDGKQDLIVGSYFSSNFSVYRNIGSPGSITASSFAAPVTFPAGGPIHQSGIALGDIDGDGKPDIAIVDQNSGLLYIYRNLSTPGTFTASSLATPVTFTAGFNSASIAIADLNGDGKPDVFISNTYGNNATIWENASSTNGNPPPPTPPIISSEPTNQTVLVGGTASFSVVASGSPTLAYQWWNGSGSITGATNSTLALNNVQLSEAGSYYVVVSNPFGSTNSSSATLTVTNPPPPPNPPVISSEPTNQTVLVGETASFSVVASGSPTLTFQWRNGSGTITGATNSTLTLNNVQLSEAGNYYVVVSNSFGSTNSSSATLTVLSPPPPATNVPVIFSFSPVSGVPGTTVSITGTNFDPVASNNVVYFGAVQAEVNAASPISLSVTVPVGATLAPITETVNGMTADSSALFLPTFPGTAPLSASSLSNSFNLNTGTYPWGVAIADLDGDGKPDLVLGNASDSSIWIYRNISSNGILSPASFAAPVILHAAPVIQNIAGIPLTLADLDGDGRLDIVFANYDDSSVSVFQNLSTPGNLSFGTRLDFAVGTNPQGSAATDLDGDGRPEIIVANRGSASISVLQNLSTGGLLTSNSFAPAMNFSTPDGPNQVVAADLDGDGKFDLAIVNDMSSSASAVSIFRNTSTPGSINFAPRVDLAAPDDTEQSIAVADIDGDGKEDLVVGSYFDSNFSVYRNIGSPGSITASSFAAPVTFPAGGPIHQAGIALGDIDGDGKPDIAIVDQDSGLLYLYRNLSTPGTFTSNSLALPVTFPAGFNSASLAIADLNGDGKPDIFIANTYGNNATIWENATPTNQSPVADASATTTLVISPNGSNATVTLDGSLSYDSDGDSLTYEWFAGAELIGTGVVATAVLPLGTNEITLAVSDGIFTNQQTIPVQVITVAQGIQQLSLLVISNATQAQSMAALLANAIKSVDKSNPTAAINQLQAFQNQINAQVEPLDPAIAQILITDAQNIIDVLNGQTPKANGKIPLFVRQANGQAYLGFSGAHQQSYSVESSDDLVHWTRKGSAQEVLNGQFEFNDPTTTNAQCRFYRVVTP